MTADIVDSVPVIRTRPLFIMQVAVDAIQAPGGPPGAARRIGDIPGGTFAGDRFSGSVLPGGSDWQTERGDGAIQLDARVLLQTDDGALIAMIYTGIRYGSPEVMSRLARGETVDPASYYFRIVPSFSTADPRYEWLNRIVAIGFGDRAPAGPIYHIEEVV